MQPTLYILAGYRSFQLLTRWFVDRGFIDPWYPCRGLCLGWPICWFQGKTEGFWIWPGVIYRFSFPTCYLCWFNLIYSIDLIFQKYIDLAVALEGLSPDVPLYRVLEGNEPCFFTTYFSWDGTKSIVRSTHFLILCLRLSVACFMLEIMNYVKHICACKKSRERVIMKIANQWY